MWNVLLRNKFNPIALAGDLKKAFLQVKIREEDRNVLKFHWIKDLQTQEVEVLRFTRALFGLVQSPFLLGATIEQHLNKFQEVYPETVQEIRKCLYVDDVITAGKNTIELKRFKETAIEIFKDAAFELHKWHSNEPSLEQASDLVDDSQTYAKEQFGHTKNQVKILGLSWDKKNDTLSVCMPQISTAETKRGILQYLASIYDPLGLLPLITLFGNASSERVVRSD